MSDEEKKAIDRLYMKATLYSVDAMDYPNSIVAKKDLVVAINLIEKQQKELKDLKDIQQQICNEELFEKEYVDKLKKEIEELKEELDDMINNVHKYFVAKDKIKAKIEEIDKSYEDSKNEDGESEYYYPNYTVEVLQSLLEKE